MAHDTAVHTRFHPITTVPCFTEQRCQLEEILVAKLLAALTKINYVNENEMAEFFHLLQ
jgi:hypothetical protein